jgi:hypothetical protein
LVEVLIARDADIISERLHNSGALFYTADRVSVMV